MHSMIAISLLVHSIILLHCSVTVEAYLSCPEVGSANFEGDGWSGYTTTNNTGLSWIRLDHQMGRNRPAADVTYRNSSGHYLFLDTASYSNGYTALLRSPQITLPNTFQEDCYVSFYYSMNSADSGSLTVYTIDDGSQIPSPVSWSRVGNQCTGNGWVFGQAKLLHGSTTGFTMYFNGTAINQALVGSGNGDGDGIGLDGISINCCSGCGSSNPLHRATFSSGFDGFQQSPHDDFYWTRNSGETPSPGTGPRYDHTVGNGGCPSSSVDGHYIHIEASTQASNGSASLVSPVFTPPAIASSVCFISFWYNMFGDGIGSLTVSALDTGNHGVRWCRHGAQQRNQASWLKAVLWIQPNESSFQVNINGTGAVDGGFQGDIAMDDIEVSCCLESCHNFEYVTFECSNQGFSLNRNGKAWFYNTTGPDHTSGLGNGRFMQSTESQMIGVERTLPDLSGYNCSISFYMWIDAPSDGAVSVSFSTVNGASTLEVWTLQSAVVPQSDWFQTTAAFKVPAGEHSFTLTWISTKNESSSWTDLRLDDLLLICCPFEAPPSTTAQSSTMTRPSATSSVPISSTISTTIGSMATGTTIVTSTDTDEFPRFAIVGVTIAGLAFFIGMVFAFIKLLAKIQDARYQSSVTTKNIVLGNPTYDDVVVDSRPASLTSRHAYENETTLTSFTMDNVSPQSNTIDTPFHEYDDITDQDPTAFQVPMKANSAYQAVALANNGASENSRDVTEEDQERAIRALELSFMYEGVASDDDTSPRDSDASSLTSRTSHQSFPPPPEMV